MLKKDQKAGRKSQVPLGWVIPEPPASWQKQELVEFQEVMLPGNQPGKSMYDYESKEEHWKQAPRLREGAFRGEFQFYIIILTVDMKQQNESNF